MSDKINQPKDTKPTEKKVDLEVKNIAEEKPANESLPAIIPQQVAEAESNLPAIQIEETQVVSNTGLSIVSKSFSPVVVNNILVDNVVNYPFLEREKQRAYCEVWAKAGIGNHKDANLVETIVTFGLSIGVPPLTALNQIYMLNGRMVMAYHLMNTLCINSGVIKVEVVREYEPIKNDKGAITNRVTQIRFTRKMKNGSPDFVYLATYYLSQAQTAGLTEKDVWQKHTKQMLLARTFAEGARFVAPDIIGGGVYVEGEI